MISRRWFLAGTGTAFAQSTARYFLTGSGEDVRTKTTPGYVLMGGGKDVDAAFRWLIERSGGGDVVVIRASGADGYNEYIRGLGAVDSVESLVIATPEEARDGAAIGRIRRAEALFIAGGDQWNYMRVWRPSPVRDAVQELIARGVPVGGTSAGLAVLGEFVFSAEKDTVTSAQALANPYDEHVTVADSLLTIAELKGAITDSHFSARDRMGRLLVFLARLWQDGRAEHPRGIAIDERTAALVERGGAVRVVGDGAVYFVRASQKAEVCRAGSPLTIGGVQVYRVKAEGRFDLREWHGEGGIAYELSVRAGVVRAEGRSGVY